MVDLPNLTQKRMAFLEKQPNLPSYLLQWALLRSNALSNQSLQLDWDMTATGPILIFNKIIFLLTYAQANFPPVFQTHFSYGCSLMRISIYFRHISHRVAPKHVSGFISSYCQSSILFLQIVKYLNESALQRQQRKLLRKIKNIILQHCTTEDI